MLRCKACDSELKEEDPELCKKCLESIKEEKNTTEIYGR